MNGISALIDIIMVAQLSSYSVGGVSLGNTLAFTVLMLLRPLLQITGTLGSQALGAGKDQRMRDVFRNGLWLAIVGGAVLAWAGLALSYYVVPYAGQDPVVVSEMQAYVDYRIWDSIAMLMMVVLGSYATTLGNNNIMTPLGIFITLLNVVLNYMFIFGNWGVPEMGVAGAGLATVLAQSVGVVIFMVYLAFQPEFRDDFRRLLQRLHRVDMSIQRDIVVNGSSLTAAGYADHILFGSISFLAGTISVSALVTQQLVGVIWMIVFVGAMAIGQAVVARAGFHAGANNTKGLLSVMVQGHKFTVMVAMFWIVLLLAAGDNAVYWILPADEPNLSEIVISYSAIMALVLSIIVFDCILGVWMGITRGLNDNRFFMYGQVIANTVGLGIGVSLCFWLDMGLYGLIMGVASAIFISVVWHVSRFIWLYNNGKLYDRVVTGDDE